MSLFESSASGKTSCKDRAVMCKKVAALCYNEATVAKTRVLCPYTCGVCHRGYKVLWSVDSMRIVETILEFNWSASPNYFWTRETGWHQDKEADCCLVVAYVDLSYVPICPMSPSCPISNMPRSSIFYNVVIQDNYLHACLVELTHLPGCMFHPLMVRWENAYVLKKSTLHHSLFNVPLLCC